MKLTVKGDNINLRAYLEREGFRFPCGGKGSCGRCRISAPSLPVTDRDRKFLTPDEIERGVRIACDKVVNGIAEIEADIARGEVKAERYERADAYAVFCDNATYTRRSQIRLSSRRGSERNDRTFRETFARESGDVPSRGVSREVYGAYGDSGALCGGTDHRRGTYVDARRGRISSSRAENAYRKRYSARIRVTQGG